MVELYPSEFVGKTGEEIIDHCYYLIEPLDDIIYYDFQDRLKFRDNSETSLDVMKDSIIRIMESEEHYD